MGTRKFFREIPRNPLQLLGISKKNYENQRIFIIYYVIEFQLYFNQVQYTRVISKKQIKFYFC